MTTFNFNFFFKLKELLFKEIFAVNSLKELFENIEQFISRDFINKIKLNIEKHPNVFFENTHQIYFGENVKIEPGCYIKGPCYIGANSEIRFGAYIRGNVITGRNCVIGHATEIKNSILLNNVKAAHFAYIGDSILGNNVLLGAGVKCANFRFDGKEISYKYEQKNVKSGLNKLGAIIGDNAGIGCNSVLNPGAILEPNVNIYPAQNIGGYITRKEALRKEKELLREIVKKNQNTQVIK